MALDLLPVVDSAPATCCTPRAEAAITAEDAVALARTLKALADPARLRLLSLIAAHEGGEACVCDLVGPIGLSQPTVSHHMKQLAEAGLVTREKRGVWAYFTIVPGAVSAVSDHLALHLGVATAGT
ncbi:ArsR/SmtB family transcription factor [Cellulomonas composti]|uniref:Transcriptional regulator n=1 Tax=Cellulomonas composti TaxID=266130 RepID=A0A511JDQ0_9CELL|nr:metalloregulator ArsR/SmtB family transcription factor [Cellulomonas composti]GEL96105.1 transcriptional regulator [Cellulomonas composti]